jgi:hypothetical protein
MLMRTWKTVVCSIAAGLCLGATSVAKADTFAYMGTFGGEFGTIDLNTGVFSHLGNSGVNLAGMAVANGMLYGASLNADVLYTINPASGAVTTVGNSGISYDDFGSTTTGFFAVGQNDNLYSVNSATGTAALIGSTGIPLGGFRGLSTNGNTLYFADGANLYTLNTTTGAGTLVGPLGDSIEIGVLLQENGTLYGGQETPSFSVDTVNPATGAAMTGPGATGTLGGEFFALAPTTLSPVPAPVIGHGLAVVLAVGGVLFGSKLLERSRKRRLFGAAIPLAAA